jgi:predicted Zn finger-like uncharacterized protein
VGRDAQPLLAVAGAPTQDGNEMRIACPACAATYDVPDRLLAGPARTLRCSRCGADFALPRIEPDAPEPPPAPSPPPSEPEPAPPPEPPPAATPEPAPEPAAPERTAPMVSRALAPVPEAASPALARAWIASIVVVAAALASFFVFHAKVMEVWPASTRLFAALGLA